LSLLLIFFFYKNWGHSTKTYWLLTHNFAFDVVQILLPLSAAGLHFSLDQFFAIKVRSQLRQTLDALTSKSLVDYER